MTEHPVDDLLFHLNGTLDAADSTRLDAHLAQCADCRAVLDEWRAIADAVASRAQAEAVTLPVLRLPDDAQITFPRIMSPTFNGKHATEEDTVMVSKPMNRPVPFRPSTHQHNPRLTLLAAMLALVLMGGLALFQTLDNPEQPAIVPAAQTDSDELTLYDALANDGRFSLFANAARRSAITFLLLQGDQELTIFAPTDDALQPYVDSGQVELSRTLTMTHIIPGIWSIEQMVTGGVVEGETMIEGRPFSFRNGYTVTQEGDTIVLDGRARIIGEPLYTAHGVIYPIDNIIPYPEILPPIGVIERSIYDMLATDSRFSLFLGALVEVPEFRTALQTDNVTVFALTNDAIRPILDDAGNDRLRLLDVLRQHIIHGIWPISRIDAAGRLVSAWEIGGNSYVTSMTVQAGWGTIGINNMATIITPDIYAANGIIHIVDAPLTQLPEFEGEN